MSFLQDPESKYEALSRYARDLTEAAKNGKLDPVIGRDDLIRRSIQILSRRTKNNPVLIGEPGVGKTAVAEGLAQRIVAGDVPSALQVSHPLLFCSFLENLFVLVWTSVILPLYSCVWESLLLAFQMELTICEGCHFKTHSCYWL